MAVRPLNWDHIIEDDDDDENWMDPGVLRSGRRCSSKDSDNDNCEREEDTQGGEKGTWKGKGTKDEKEKDTGKAIVEGKGKGNEMGNSKGKSIVKQTPRGDDISRAAALQLQKKIYGADSDTEG